MREALLGGSHIASWGQLCRDVDSCTCLKGATSQPYKPAVAAPHLHVNRSWQLRGASCECGIPAGTAAHLHVSGKSRDLHSDSVLLVPVVLCFSSCMLVVF